MMRLLVLLVLLTMVFGTMPASAQDDVDLAHEFYLALNRQLIEDDTLPLARNPILDQVAAAIAEEISQSGTAASSPRQLARRLEYPLWPDNSQRVMSEAYTQIGILPPAAVARVLVQPIRGNIANGGFREAGIATSSYLAAPGATLQDVYVIVLGAQPNVLPVIVGAGDDIVYDRDVELYIHNESSLDYMTNDDTIQRVKTIKVANSLEELEDASLLEWDDNHFGMLWTVTEDYGDKSIWVEFEDSKGTTVRYEAVVTLEDPAEMPTSTPNPEAEPTSLLLTYGGNALTLQLSSENRTVKLDDILFSWLNDTRTYQLSNADDLSGVKLDAFNSSNCIQISVRGQTPQSDIPGCQEIYLDDNEFTELSRVFWNPDFIEFKVYDGQDELGTCSTRELQCEIQLP